GGGFHMTMAAARIDPRERTLSWWNAAGPEVFVVRDGAADCLSAPGSVLGDDQPPVIGACTVPFAPGDRLLLCTGGVLELRREDGRPLGARQLCRLLARLGASGPEATCARLGEELNRTLGGRPQEDDITFIVVESVAPGAPNAPTEVNA